MGKDSADKGAEESPFLASQNLKPDESYVYAEDHQNKKSFKGIASAGKKFVYFFSLNTGIESRDKPFFIDQGSNLKSRLARHRLVTWHTKQFNRPIRVTIAATVSSSESEKATEELVKKFFENGYFLINGSPQNDYFTLKEVVQRLEEVTVTQLTDEIVAGWKQNWNVKLEPKQEDLFPIEAKPVTSYEVKQYFRLRNYSLKQSSLLSQKLSANYDSTRQMSQFVVGESKKPKVLADLKKAFKGLQGDWQLETSLKEGMNTVRLSDSSIRGIIARRTQ